MLKGVIKQWRHDWYHEKIIFWFELIGVIGSLAAAVMISFWPGQISMVWIFSLWLVGSSSLAISSFLRRTAWPLLLMSTYTVLNMIGLSNTL